MAISEADIERNTMRYQYTWQYLLSYIVCLVSYVAKSDMHGIPNAGFFHNLRSIPPIGPPISVL